MATPAPVAPPPATIRSHGWDWARRRRYISERVIQPPLKHELQGELNLPRRKRGSNRSKTGIGDIRRRRPEVRVVQNVEELRAELQGHSFARGDPEVLVHSHIPLPEIGAAERVAAHVAERRGSRRNRESGFVEVLGD